MRVRLLADGSIGLSMIVKNEAPVIARCLATVRPLISYWTVVDTGSTDGTQDIVRRVLAGIPGELHERPWVDFAHNRNEALALAVGKTSHALVIDADDVLELADDFELPQQLTLDAYTVTVIHGEITHARPHVFRPEKFSYAGVLHETISVHVPDNRLPGVTMRIVGGGNRSKDPEKKFLDDAEVLKRALEREPKNNRYAFYLAQSWRDAYRMKSNKEHLGRALRAYARRATMGGFGEEVFWSLLEVARCHENLGRDREATTQAYLAAYRNRPQRAEPLFSLARWLRMSFEDHASAVVYARHAAALPKPAGETLWVEHAIYDWWALDEFAVAASWIPALHPEARVACVRLLECAPEREFERIHGMLKICGG
jgi:glycosyltransferase involved in cell wall biosynthesis